MRAVEHVGLGAGANLICLRIREGIEDDDENEVAICVLLHRCLPCREGIESAEDVVDPHALGNPTDRPCRPHGLHWAKPAGHRRMDLNPLFLE